MELTTYRHCSIKAEDDLIDIDDGMIIIDQSQASVFEWDSAKGRFSQVDRLIGVEVKPSRGEAVVNLTATSEHLLKVVRLPAADAKLTVTVTPGAGCRDCG